MSRPKKVGRLSFKDINAFNVAQLGKQLWRMMTHKDSLMAKVFKGSYFHKYDPLSTSLGSRPSYVWQSIHTAQPTIRKGARKTIRNGVNVKVWEN